MTDHVGQSVPRITNVLGVRQMPPRQDSLTEQLEDVHLIAARIGCYDAADWLWKHALSRSVGAEPEHTPRGPNAA